MPPVPTLDRVDETWQVAYFARHPDDDPARTAPGREFRASCPPRVRATIDNVLLAVAAAPPTKFAGGGMWEAMHGALRGYHEVRVRHARLLYRVFCRLDRDPASGRCLLTVLCGAIKPVGTRLTDAEYARVLRYGTEYLSRVPRSVL